MSKNKPPQVPKKNAGFHCPLIGGGILTFVAASGQGGVETVYADENV